MWAWEKRFYNKDQYHPYITMNYPKHLINSWALQLESKRLPGQIDGGSIGSDDRCGCEHSGIRKKKKFSIVKAYFIPKNSCLLNLNKDDLLTKGYNLVFERTLLTNDNDKHPAKDNDLIS